MKPGGPYEPLHFRLVEHPQDFLNLREAWGDLISRSDTTSVFLTWEWLYSWWSTKWSNQELCIATVWEGQALAGVAPLMLERQKRYGLNLRTLCSLGGLDIDVGGFIARRNDPRVLPALCRGLANTSRRWEVIILHQFPLDALFTQELRASMKQEGLSEHLHTEHHMVLPVHGSWQSYIQSLSGGLRRDLRKMTRRAEKQGPLAFEHYTGMEVTPERLEALFDLNERSHYPGLYNPQERLFQRRLLAETASQGMPDLSFIRFGGKLIAFLYGFVSHNRMEAWRAGYDLAYHEFAVGKLLLFRVLEGCFERGYREIDFLRGEQGYKERLQLCEQPYARIQLVPKRKLLPLALKVWLPRLKAGVKARLSKEDKTASDDNGRLLNPSRARQPGAGSTEDA